MGRVAGRFSVDNKPIRKASAFWDLAKITKFWTQENIVVWNSKLRKDQVEESLSM